MEPFIIYFYYAIILWGVEMSEIVAAVTALFAISASLVVYFKFIDKPLDRTLDRVFASWHKEEIEELEEF